MKWRRRLGLLVFAAAVIAALVWGFMPKPVLVETQPAVRAPLQVTVEEEGKTRVVDRFVVSAPTAGFARRAKLDVGDVVRRGQVLLTLDPLRSTVLDPRARAEAQARVAAAEAALKAAKENVDAAAADASYWETQLARSQELHESGTISDEALSQAEADSRRTRANLRSAEFSVDVARHDLQAAQTALRHSAAQQSGKPAETVAVHAPVGGSVLKVLHESEGVVAAGEALLEIGNSRHLEVVVELLSADAVRTGPGTRVLLERWGGERPLEGRVRLVEPFGFTKISALGVEEQRVLVISDIVSPPEEWERLGDGYRVESKFVLWEEDNVLQVPSSSLFRRGEEWAVFVVNSAHVQLRTVELGRRSGLTAQVLTGIEEGDLVITHPDDEIEDGLEVQPREQTEQGP